jgi:hypothetical protein
MWTTACVNKKYEKRGWAKQKDLIGGALQR